MVCSRYLDTSWYILCVCVSNASPDDASRAPLTEVRLLPDEFDVYQIGVDSSLTYCLKELRVCLCLIPDCIISIRVFSYTV